MKLSILTPTYNRANYLNKLFESIVNNLIEELEVEWLIMDDGSTDNTYEVLDYIKEKAYNSVKSNHFEVKIYRQVNQGKMKAINNLMEYVTGELVMTCDSDDYFVKDAFKRINEKKDILFNENDLYALAFLKNETPEKLSGNTFDKENETTSMFDLYFKQGITGEKILVFKTEIRKQYMHEVIERRKVYYRS